MTQDTDWMAQYGYWNKTRFNPYVNRDDLTAIGEIVVIWGQIETVIQHLIWGYCEFTTHNGMVVTGSLPLNSKRLLLSTLAKHYEKQTPRVAVLNGALNDMETLQPKRNSIFHGLWLLAAPLEYRKLGMNPTGPKSEPLNVDLSAFAMQSGELHTKLEDLDREPNWQEAVAALPEVSFSPESNFFLT
jgi:hypothetical protein